LDLRYVATGDTTSNGCIMRFHEPWMIFPSKLPSGLTVSYSSRTRDENGQPILSWKTGQTSKTAAREYYRKLQAERRAAPRPLLFSNFASTAGETTPGLIWLSATLSSKGA
jgi:hypothetical protein